MVYILFDNPADKAKMDFFKRYGMPLCKQIYPAQKCLSTYSMIKICTDCISRSTNGDIIICWYDFMGILCWWISILKHKDRRIIALNLLLKDKKTIKNKIAKIMYRTALKSHKLQATVNSNEYGEWLNNLLGIRKEYTLLHDIYHSVCRPDIPVALQPKSIFCGGRNGRDWHFLLEIAQKISDVQFNCVMSKQDFDKYKSIFTDNIKAQYELSENDFLELMYQSEMVVMPLDTDAPAGLIVMFQAAALGKMIITSDTIITNEYFSHERGVLCQKSVSMWEKQIRYYLAHKDEAQIRADKFRDFLEEECTESKYIDTLKKMVIKANA